MYGLDLFSGIGGVSLALSEYVQTIAYCEIEPYCQNVLLQRMANGLLDRAPIWDDVRTFRPESIKHKPDIICGGFPCQDISIIHQGQGLRGEKSGLFFEIIRICKFLKPLYIFLENVPAITHRGGVEVIKQITTMGYSCKWCVISAESIGASQIRERFFLLAHSNCSSEYRFPIRKEEGFTPFRTLCKYNMRFGWDEDSSPFCRENDGVPHRLDRLRALGNSVVPLQAKKAFELLLSLDDHKLV